MVQLKPTKRQEQIFDVVRKYWERHGYPPTVREIGKAVGLTSPSTVHAHLANLEKAGFLKRDPTKPRALELLIDKTRQAGQQAQQAALQAQQAAQHAAQQAAEAAMDVLGPTGIPLVGRVAAGQPVLAEENIEEYVQVPRLIGGDEGEYLLRVTGDSMKDVGIMDGDFVVVRPQSTASNGEIVVALTRGEATVKRFFKEADHVRLEAENPDFKPIRRKDIEVVGGVVGVMRSLR